MFFLENCIDVKEYIIKNNISPAPVKVEASAPAAAPVSKSAVSSDINPEYEPDFEDIELSNMRKVIAKRLVLSKVINQQLKVLFLK